MKRALAERAREEEHAGGSHAPSPTKKFARFGGRDKSRWHPPPAAANARVPPSVPGVGPHIHPVGSSGPAYAENAQGACGVGVGHANYRHPNFSVPQHQQPPQQNVPLPQDSSTLAQRAALFQGKSLRPPYRNHVEGNTSHDGPGRQPPGSSSAMEHVQSSSGEAGKPPSQALSMNATMQESDRIRSPPPNTESSTAGKSDLVSGGGTPLHSTPKPVVSTSSSTSSHPSVKVKRRRSTTRTVTTPLITTVVMPTHSGDEQDDDDDPDSNGTSVSRRYFLQFQNRALVSELHQAKHELNILEEERFQRRRQCDLARKLVDDVNGCWTVIEHVLGDSANLVPPAQNRDGTLPVPPCYPSTGGGSEVETVGSLLASLSTLARRQATSPPSRVASAGEGQGETEGIESDEEFLTLVLGPLEVRVQQITSLILRLVQRIQVGSINGGGGPDQPLATAESLAESVKRITSLEGDVTDLTARVQELSDSRDESRRNEKRIRRYLNRVLAGQSPLDVLKDVEGLDHDGLDESTMLSSTSPGLGRKQSSRNLSEAGGLEGEKLEDLSAEDKSVLQRCKERAAQLEGICETRKERIDALVVENEALQRRINTLLLPHRVPLSSEADMNGEKPADEGKGSDDIDASKSLKKIVKSHPLYQELLAKCREATSNRSKLEQEVTEWKDRFAHKAGENEALQRGLEEQRTKFDKRWKEIMEHNSVDNMPDENGDVSGGTCGNNDKKTILSLEHKLNQALETARHVDVYRQALVEATGMVETLQTQSAEIRGKYQAALAQNKNQSSSGATGVPSSSGAASSGSGHTSSSSSSSLRRSSVEGGGTGGGSSGDVRLQKENRRMRKEIAALHASRESAKAKVEKLTQERDQLLKTNSRLLSQSSEKEEINTESLSSVLHLREQLKTSVDEKDALEKKYKSAQQLALASRLASTARDRTVEDAKTATADVEKQLEVVHREKSDVLDSLQKQESMMHQAKNQIATLEKDLNTSQERCEELTTETTSAKEGSAHAIEELRATRKQVVELKKSVAAAAASSSSGKGKGGGEFGKFTAEQVATQVTVLKSRLACPVCNHRDKTCILLRCRHMFCRQCVDNNIKNRSRKCPACATRFDTKDVGEIWL